ncbi:NAD(P)-binding Rossmann-fold containing protein [Glarea lozoyensis ATCC 20868]|uniref:NAD(P)-binding Rossmann-fold containing protein n=1 Tax=Glarea lozoyensis (strain ATCC 20868 / MF5171) TaxID=1116229 RepID=S3DJ45_GLAL2|nr:NAD(P)-binding Rossmann-fold containing protein [Glarea lozoyensis ATCC 20868]EPE37169.1 NAD(P)-binding Rossmann-fold containing protein [Glarea lozoyensis ATCC 20868]
MATASPPKHPHLGAVLVTGGCGFLGHHLVRALLDNPSVSSVSVLSRNPRQNRYPEVSYYVCDITSRENVQTLFKKIQPRVIFHTASPYAYSDPPNPARFQREIVEGTANLLACAKELPSITSFIYTSSIMVYATNANRECIMADEESDILHGPVTRKNAYDESKATADTMVLAADDPTHFRTVCVRISGIYGEGESNDSVTTRGLNMVYSGRANIQLGDNTSLFDPIYIHNAVHGHIFIANALIDELDGPLKTKSNGKVHGEAFNLSDDSPIPFWDFLGKVFAEAGCPQTREGKTVIPNWAVIAMCCIAECMYWILFLGKRRPKDFLRKKLEHVYRTRTLNIEKAKGRLGWYPPIPMDEAIKRSVSWCVEKMGKAKSN